MMKRSSTLSALLWCLVVATLQCAHADQSQEAVYDQYSLHASAEGEVENDLMRVWLVVQHEDRDAQTLASKVNSDMQWALAQLGAFESVSHKTEGYTTYPKYEQQRIAGWRSAQTLSLSGSDFDQVKGAVQILQSRLQVQNMVFQPRDETRRKMEDQLINQALDNLKHRATFVQRNMGVQSYRIMHLNIDTGHRVAPAQRMEATMMRSAAADVAPAVAGGESKISVTVSGRIQLQ
jgi:predicted secreted protein